MRLVKEKKGTDVRSDDVSIWALLLKGTSAIKADKPAETSSTLHTLYSSAGKTIYLSLKDSLAETQTLF